MIRNIARKSLLALAAAAIAVVGTSSASWASFDRRDHRGGFVMPCSLDGVNPVYHPYIFGNPAVAAEYGFVQSRDGSWRVRPDCQRGVTVPY